MRQLKEYENELIIILNSDKKNWTRFYILMKEIEDNELFKELGLGSFTAWVKQFSVNNKIHESVIWNRKKAGKVYERYYDVQKEKGIEIEPLEKAQIGVDSLVLLDKISKKDEKLGAELTEKAMNKELTRADLRNAYKIVRGDLSKKCNSNNDNKDIDDNSNMDSDIIIEETVTSAKIVSVLLKPNWLGGKCKRKAFKGAFEQDKYKAITEFPVYTGTTRKPRRIDVLVAENLKVEDHYSLNVHGIEIKVSKSDLINDMKYSEYAEFVNYLWLAIPINLLDAAIKNVPELFGILLFENDKIQIFREAKVLSPIKIKDTLTTLSLRLI